MKDDAKIYKRDLKEWYKNIKASRCCEICNSNRHKEFHHMHPYNKKGSISEMVHNAYPKEVIIEEMNKCLLVCRKCHRNIHSKNKKNSRQH